MHDERPFGHHTVTLPALFIPEGNPDNISAADIVSAIGPHAVMLPAVFIPDGYDGPRPAYPWIELGRMTLPGRRAAARGVTDTGARAPDVIPAGVSLSDASHEATAPYAPVAAFPVLGEVPGEADATEAAGMIACGSGRAVGWRGSGPDIAAAMAAWTAVTDPRVVLAVLDAASASNPVVKSLAEGRVPNPAVKPVAEPASQAMGEPRVLAFLKLLRYAETRTEGSDDTAYHRLVGGGTVADLDRFPSRRTEIAVQGTKTG
jgi:hypothetical protein